MFGLVDKRERDRLNLLLLTLSFHYERNVG